MQTTRWNRRRLAIAALILFGMYVVFSASYNKYEIDGTVRNANPEKVWDFVADFTNMMLLNPTIIGFRITSDDGNYHHWKYSVIYTEKLSHWPYWLNEASADVAVKRTNDDAGKEQFFIESEHKTCFLKGLYCLKSQGTFQFGAVGTDTYCRETIYYQCPPFFGPYCRNEVQFQRRAIMDNLSTLMASRVTNGVKM